MYRLAKLYSKMNHSVCHKNCFSLIHCHSSSINHIIVNKVPEFIGISVECNLIILLYSSSCLRTTFVMVCFCLLPVFSFTYSSYNEFVPVLDASVLSHLCLLLPCSLCLCASHYYKYWTSPSLGHMVRDFHQSYWI